jgi:hypothetical protein
MHISAKRFELRAHHQFEVEVRNLPNRRRMNVYWIKDTLTSYTMCVRQIGDKYSFVEMMEEEAERKVIEYECEQFFHEDHTYNAALLKFAIRIVQSTFRLW